MILNRATVLSESEFLLDSPSSFLYNVVYVCRPSAWLNTDWKA
jgi:hypothetical protein